MANFKLIEKVRGQKSGITAVAVHRLNSVGTGVASLYVYPTAYGNCQTFAVGYFRSMFLTTEDYKNAMSLIQELRQVAGTTKRMCQVDIKRDVFDKIKPYINVHSAMPYTNLTGSKMVSLIIRVAN